MLQKAYANRLDPSADPMCTLCKEEPQTIEHWLQRCPRLGATRQNINISLKQLLQHFNKSVTIRTFPNPTEKVSQTKFKGIVV